MAYQQATSLTLPQTLALFQMRIDPTVNLISMNLCRAFSFTALYSAKQTWLFHSMAYHSENETLSRLRESCNVRPPYYQNQKDMLKNVLML